MTKKIYLDPGHGGSDPGASGNGLKEKDVVLKIARYTRDYLNDNYTEHSIRMSRTTDKTVSLASRTNDANRWGADVFVSIHINAGGGKGYEDFIYNGSVSQNTRNLQNAVHKEVSKLFGTNRGKKRANFHVLRETRMSAVLTECGFIDNKDDAAYLKKDSNLKKLGEAHAKGIASFLKLKKKLSSSSKKPSAGGGSKKIYRVQIGAFSKKANADNLVKQAKSKGFKDAFVKKEGSLYKVQVGAFSVKKNAENMLKQAKSKGFKDAFIA